MEESPAFVSKNNTYESQLLPNTLNPRGMTGREASTLVARPWPARETQRQQDPVVTQSGFGGGCGPSTGCGDATHAGNTKHNSIASNVNHLGVTSARGRIVSNDFQVFLKSTLIVF